jgi:transposase-like protein
MTVLIEVRCPDCGSKEVVKNGKSATGEQKYLCKNPDCERTIFMLNYKNKGCLAETKNMIVEMALNGSGIRDTARVLQISPDTVLSELKKKHQKSKK